MNIDLKKALPDFVGNIYEIGAILSSISAEIQRLYEKSDEVFLNLSLKKAQSRLELWEREFSVSDGAEKAEDIRKQALLSKMGLLGTQTRDTIYNLVATYSEAQEISVKEGGFSVTINTEKADGISRNIPILIREIKNALPVHLTLDFNAKSNQRVYCMPRKLLLGSMAMEIEIGDEK